MNITGSVRVPGDKSITHRALMLAAMAGGTSHLGGALTSLDARSTARVLRDLGARISPLRAGTTVVIAGPGRLRRPDRPLNCGNSGTAARLILGLLAAHSFRASITGDRSLRRRPMRRVTEPLSLMGARFEGVGDGLPLQIRGGALRALRYELPVSSAQLKSAILFAGLAGNVPVFVREPGGRSRDHTERLLRSFGYSVGGQDGWIDFEPDGAVTPFELQVPGDFSSAIFLIGAALLAEGGELRVAGVGLNPTRTSALDVLSRMGAGIAVEPTGEERDEPVGDIVVRPSDLRGTAVPAAEIPGLIDEIPLLAVLASRAEGTTTFHQAGELRVKESDRLALLAGNLRALGVAAEAQGQDLHVEGTDAPPQGRVRTDGDHRIAMAFAVLATVPGARVRIDDMDCAAVSFPNFAETLAGVRGDRR
jgi:3-phosphoshikimate 1-carboxyvinyltransferase